MDFSTLKALAIPEGDVKKIECNGSVLWELSASIKNWVKYAIDTDGSIFNDCGYMAGQRVRSSGAIGSWNADNVAFGFVPVKAGDIIRFIDTNWTTKDWSLADNGNAISFGHISNGAYTMIGTYTGSGSVYGQYQQSAWGSDAYKPSKQSDGSFMCTVPPDSTITHMRMSSVGSGESFIITINEELPI